ncbi:unnamed protein product [Cylindrotheca closterium]|uniref:Erythromycin biosynthesis protein CIII-like C-terminal domain-containing protein n=1 Tax=Cylindrotheca closterium TaxID=2856 RepID=A0AAD2FQC2_9STRA|nr:unnamed protein product [Cylindrotheca closterium]
MHVIMISVGSWGDTEPYLALAQELLTNSNHCDTNSTNNKVDFFVQSQYESRVKQVTTTTLIGDDDDDVDVDDDDDDSSLQNPFHQNNFRLHALPFSTQDFYKVKPNTTTNNNNNNNNQDPKLKHVATVAEIMGELVLPCARWILDSIAPTIANKSNTILLSSALSRPLGLLLAQVLEIPMVLLHLQPLVPNTIFPLYRVVPIETCVQAMLLYNNDDHNQYYEQTYWKIDHPLEEIFLRDRLIAAYDQFGLVPPTWSELQTILAGGGGGDANDDDDDHASKIHPHHHQEVVHIVNCYSNHLIPSIVGTPGVGPNVHEIGCLADAYIPWNYKRTLNPDLETFLQSCKKMKNTRPPICIGFGSMPFSELSAVMDALIELEDIPAILVGKPFQFTSCPPRYQDLLFTSGKVFRMEFVPYAHVLPKCSMMLCHGGAGVVHATIRAGIPCLVHPIMGDQFLFASLLEQKGLGVRIIIGTGGDGGGDGGDATSKRQLLQACDIVRAVRKVDSSSSSFSFSSSSSSNSIRTNCQELRQKIITEENDAGIHHPHGVVQMATLLQQIVLGNNKRGV